MRETTRRRLLIGVGTATVASLAGCTGGDGDGDGEPTTDGGGDTTDGDGQTSDDVPAAIDNFLANANGYDGQILDATGQDSVTVGVGGSANVFDPVAVRVDTGTTVDWEWQGGTHNVVSTEESASDFDSGEPTGDTSTTFSQSFDNAGVQLYICEVHEFGGMVGAVDVVEG